MTDARGGNADVPTVEPPTSHPFHHLFGKVSQAAHGLADKVHEIATDPKVQQQVQAGTHIAGNIGIGVVTGVKNDGVGMAHDVQTGNYAGAALRAAPLLAGGPIGLVVKEVAPHVVAEGLKQLPPGTQRQIASSGAGRLVLGAAEHGRIPTSPIGLAGIVAAPLVVSEGVAQLPPGTRSQIQGSGVGRAVIGAAERGYMPTSPVAMAHSVAEYSQREAIDLAVRNALAGRLTGRMTAPEVTISTSVGTVRRVSPGQGYPGQGYPSQAYPGGTEQVATTLAKTGVSVSPGQIYRRATAPAAAATSSEATVAPVNVVNRGNQVFPSWMKPAVPNH